MSLIGHQHNVISVNNPVTSIENKVRMFLKFLKEEKGFTKCLCKEVLVLMQNLGEENRDTGNNVSYFKNFFTEVSRQPTQNYYFCYYFFHQPTLSFLARKIFINQVITKRLPYLSCANLILTKGYFFFFFTFFQTFYLRLVKAHH